ncbi:type VI secretion system tube protein TssD [Spirosoma gilvum]
MANKAILSVCGRDFNVLEFKVSLYQQTNNEGKPASGVFFGDFFMIIRGGNDTFFEWISEPTRMESGVLKTFRADQDNTPFVEYSFVQGFLSSILENYYYTADMQNSFNTVSDIESDGEDFELWINAVTFQRDNGESDIGAHVLGNSIAKTRTFQKRTGISYVLMISMSCMQITIRDVDHKNQWGR